MADATNVQRTFTKTIDGKKHTQVAYSEADAVRFVFDGWREAKPVQLFTTEGDTKTGDTKTGGKNR
jgi:ribosome modulation factor